MAQLSLSFFFFFFGITVADVAGKGEDPLGVTRAICQSLKYISLLWSLVRGMGSKGKPEPKLEYWYSISTMRRSVFGLY